MPTEREILAAGPLRPDDPEVQVALKKLSVGVVHGLLRLEERAHRTAAEQPAAEEDPPRDKNGAGAAPLAPTPAASRRTNTTNGSHPERRRLCLPPV